MNTISDLLLSIQMYVQYNGVSPTLEELNAEIENDNELSRLTDSFGIYEREPYQAELLDGAVADGYIVCDGEMRLFLLPEIYQSVAVEMRWAGSSTLSYREYMKRRLNSGYEWVNNQLVYAGDKGE